MLTPEEVDAAWQSMQEMHQADNVDSANNEDAGLVEQPVSRARIVNGGPIQILTADATRRICVISFLGPDPVCNLWYTSQVSNGFGLPLTNNPPFMLTRKQHGSLVTMGLWAMCTGGVTLSILEVFGVPYGSVSRYVSNRGDELDPIGRSAAGAKYADLDLAFRLSFDREQQTGSGH